MSASQTANRTPSISETMPRFLGTASRRAVLGFGVVVLIVFWLTVSDDWLSIANYTMIYAIAVLALNVVSGYTGQVSLGMAFFMSIGAYTAVWLGSQPITLPFNNGHGLQQITYYGLNLPVYIWLPAAGIVAALVGAIIGPTALRLKGFYLGIVSLALIFIGIHIFKSTTLLTGGPEGRNFILSPNLGGLLFTYQSSLFGLTLTENQQFFLLILVVLVLSALFVGNVMRSRAGRAFQAVRDHEVGAAIMGVNVFQTKMAAFMFSSFLAGIAGALFGAYSQYIRPDQWSLLLSIQFVAALIIGGAASVWGSLLGAAFVFALPQVLDQLQIIQQSSNSTISSGDVNTIIYGLLIILFLLFEPRGLVGLIRRVQLLAQRLNQRFRKGGGEPAETTPGSEFEVERSALLSGEGTQPLAE
jgi:branched-chain amino acid transport system permease protein